MEKIVVDSSVGVKWFIEEDGTDEARQLLEKHRIGEITLYAPDIFILELINALYYQGFSKSQLNQAIELIYQAEIVLISLSEELLTETSSIVATKGIASYDSLFIAVAKLYDCSLISADLKHHKKKLYKKIRYL